MLLTLKEACVFLSVKQSWMRSAIFKKKISYVKIGRMIKFKRSDLEAFIELNRREVQ